jgi:predicted nucleic acid-binding protein
VNNVVLDASFYLALVLEDEFECKQIVKSVFDKIEDGDFNPLMPLIFKYEVSNALLVAMRRSRLEKVGYMRNIQVLEDFCQLGSEECSLDAISELAIKYGLSFYDAAYLELAISTSSVALFTFDKKLKEAAEYSGIKTNI